MFLKVRRNSAFTRNNGFASDSVLNYLKSDRQIDLDNFKPLFEVNYGMEASIRVWLAFPPSSNC